MHVLLPPSETKRRGGGTEFIPKLLAHAGVLGAARAVVREALVTLCHDEAEAARRLKLGARSRGEIQANLELSTSGCLPALARYTGVLYDALAVDELDVAAHAWLSTHVSVQSALFGLIGGGDCIPSYRLSAGTRLDCAGATLKSTWQQAHTAIDWPAYGWVLDLRSNDYAALAPLPPECGTSMLITQRSADGEVRALNHFNKAAKGALVRQLAESRPEITTTDDFVDWGRQLGLDISRDESTGKLVLVTTAPPAPARRASVRMGTVG